MKMKTMCFTITVVLTSPAIHAELDRAVTVPLDEAIAQYESNFDAMQSSLQSVPKLYTRFANLGKGVDELDTVQEFVLLQQDLSVQQV